MKFVIEPVNYFRTYCDDCGWESDADSETVLRLYIEAHVQWSHEGESVEYDN